MFARLGNFVSRRWLIVILCWMVAVATIRIVAPPWDEITHDGDFAYLPEGLPSAEGQRLMAEAFPHLVSRSQAVVFIARERGSPTPLDEAAAFDLTRRFENINGATNFHRAKQLIAKVSSQRDNGRDGEALKSRNAAHQHLVSAARAFLTAIQLDKALVDSNFADPNSSLPAIYHNSALLIDYVTSSGLQAELEGLHGGDDVLREYFNTEVASAHRRHASQLDAKLGEHSDQLLPRTIETFPVLRVWTWQHKDIGSQLSSTRPGAEDPTARLILVHLDSEFMAVGNLRVLEHFRREVDQVRKWMVKDGWLSENKPELVIGISGSAAIGTDLLLAAKDSIANTELFTIVLVTGILLLVYRSPLLVAIPLITIFVSFLTATGIVALLTQLGNVPGFEWWDFKVFKTSKIFIVVILFGAGTDYCLFLISRYREELQGGLNRQAAVGKSMAAVGDALAASALTTIIGLAMMFFAEFGKFSNSGPAIGLCLAVTLLASLTFAPALLRALGPIVFWPMSVRANELVIDNDNPQKKTPGTRLQGFWQWTARHITAHPGRILVVTFALLSPLAWCGVFSGGNVTYDLLSELEENRPSVQATHLLANHFPVGESGAVVILAQKDGVNFNDLDPSTLDAVWELSKTLYDRKDVRRVRSIATPYGKSPGERRSLDWKKAAEQSSPLVRSIYITPQPRFRGSVTRLEVVLQHDTFSLRATEALSAIDQLLREESAKRDSFWSGATFAFSGTTASMRDLRDVTRRDNVRIEILVVIAVLAVLLIILRRPLVCVYMILTVLFTYFVTIGGTELFFQWAYGDSFQGLDWKVPLFLFVILVAVGQDYNVYLATRVFEEQKTRGPFSGLRFAVQRTGGIITSCGVIMAGTFISMTSGTWGSVLPDWLAPDSGGALRGIVELGFALSLGVMLDTFIVRPILLPAFLALLCRWRRGA